MAFVKPIDFRQAGGLAQSARAWFAIAIVGQLLFVAYISVHYVAAMIRGDIAAWNAEMLHGFVAGDAVGNVTMASHLVLAVILTLGGPLQLSTGLRARLPRLHRWSGRVYLATALAVSLGGLYLVWARGVPGGLVNAIGVSLNGVLIIAFAAMALRAVEHRRWAIRLFLVASGVFLLRVGVMVWLVIHRAPVGIGDDFDGPFVQAWIFGYSLLPLAIYELYVRIEKRGGAIASRMLGVAIAVLTLATAVGVAAAFVGIWLPMMRL
jgi:hypothetical protein